MLGSYSPPECWNFRPFFTIQPVKPTKDKQLKLWKDIILEYHMQNNVCTMNVATCPLFENKTIDRRLSIDGIKEIIDHLIASENAAWEDSAHTIARVMWKTPDTIAAEVYNWACQNDYLNTIFTVFELHSGDEHTDSGFHGTDSFLFVKSMEKLAADGKCVIIPGDTRDEDGVKFI
ncbi:unnamed protein product [Ectocarpus fasciculatus]